MTPRPTTLATLMGMAFCLTTRQARSAQAFHLSASEPVTPLAYVAGTDLQAWITSQMLQGSQVPRSLPQLVCIANLSMTLRRT